MTQYEKNLEHAVRVARHVATLLKNFDRKKILDKRGRDVKHVADLSSEKTILDELRAFSDYSVLSEEAGLIGEPSPDLPFWIVDPLDGTLNFSREIPLCCVSIALFKSQQPILGVVYDFNHDECFTGLCGVGAWLNGRPIKPSRQKDIRQSVLATGFPVNRNFDSESLLSFVDIVRTFKKIRLLGSAALSLAYTACGRVDAYFEEDIMLWDVAAGIAIAEAAGAIVKQKKSQRKTWALSVKAGSSFA